MSSPVRFPQDHHYDFDLWIWHLLTMFEKAKAYPLKLRRVLPKISRMFDSWVVIDRERLDFLDFFGLEEVTDLSWRLSSSEVSEVKSMTSMSSVLTAKPDLFISIWFWQIFLGKNNSKINDFSFDSELITSKSQLVVLPQHSPSQFTQPRRFLLKSSQPRPERRNVFARGSLRAQGQTLDGKPLQSIRIVW